MCQTVNYGLATGQETERRPALPRGRGVPPARPHRPRRHPAHHVLRLVLRRATPHRARAGRDPRDDGRAVHPPLHPDDVGQRVQHRDVHVAPGAGHLPAGRGARSTRSRRSGRGPVLRFAQVRIPGAAATAASAWTSALLAPATGVARARERDPDRRARPTARAAPCATPGTASGPTSRLRSRASA